MRDGGSNPLRFLFLFSNEGDKSEIYKPYYERIITFLQKRRQQKMLIIIGAIMLANEYVNDCKNYKPDVVDGKEVKE